MTAPEHYGATPGAWSHWDLVLGLGGDLLPVVSNPMATISPGSKMKGLGKAPSMYNKSRKVAGIVDWTSHVTTDREIARWAAEPEYGICLQTRTVRALDVDVTDPTLAKEIHDEIVRVLGFDLPARRRVDSSKFLLVFALPGAYPKRILPAGRGAIEFLGTGNQAVIDGTHPSGARYAWAGGFPNHIPELAPEVFEALWARLVARFAVGDSTTGKLSTKAATLTAAVENDPVAQELITLGATVDRDGKVRIECPFSDGHTPGGDDSIIYYPAATGGYTRGNAVCLHASCADRTREDFLGALGIAPPEEDYRDDFAAIPPSEEKPVAKAVRFAFIGDDVFAAGKPMGWIIKGVLPKAELGVVYGPPSSGKSFWTLDMVMAVARGVPWCNKRVNQTTVGYIAAEGAGGFKNRIQAYREFHGISGGPVIHILADVPNLLEKQDVIDLGNAILRMGGFGVLVYDTLARGTSGGDENSAQDMGLAIANCRTLHEVTGAMVILIHHSGKDISKGARGSNAILGAVDVEIEISRFDSNRTATVSKLKDGEDGGQYGFVLKTVPIGMDEDGDVISSCVVEHGAVAPRKEREKKMGPREEAALHTFNRMSDDLAGKVLTIAEVSEAAAAEYGGRPSNMVTSLYALEKRGLVDLSDGKNCKRGGQ